MKRTGVMMACLALVGAGRPLWGLTVTEEAKFNRANFKITWKDLSGRDRVVFLCKARPHAGIVQSLSFYDGSNRLQTVEAPPGAGTGFGEIVHHGSTYSSSGTVTKVFQGASTAIFDFKKTIDRCPETVRYVFLDGLDYFQYAYTTDARAGAKAGDTRTPYCSIDWTGGGSKAEGLEYGAKRYFKQPVLSHVGGDAWNNWSGAYTFGGTCDIPYAWEWNNTHDREVGFVQTQTWAQQHSGVPVWSDANIRASGEHMGDFWHDPLWATDYQMNFYDCSMKIVWGQPYGWMNASGDALPAMKNKWGQYSLSIVFDAKSDGGVMRIRDENRITHDGGLKVGAVAGALKTRGPAGSANPALQDLSPAGFDHVHRAWWVAAASGRAALNFNLGGSGRYRNPTFRISGVSSLPAPVSLNGAPQSEGKGYYASLDEANGEAWITFVHDFTGDNVIQFGAAPGGASD